MTLLGDSVTTEIISLANRQRINWITATVLVLSIIARVLENQKRT